MFRSLVRWISSSLNRKFVAGTAGGLIAFSVIFLMLFIGMYQGQLRQEKMSAADQVNRLLQTSLEAAMLRRDLDMLRSIVDQLGKQQSIESVMIVSRSGEIRFSDRPDRLYKPMALNCDGCRFDPARTTAPFSFFTRDEQGQQVLRTVQPVANKTQCGECHGPLETNPVNGTLIVDYDATALQRHAGKTTLLLMGSGSIVVLVNLVGGWWFIRRFVLRPIDQLERTSHALAEGDLGARVTVNGKDELAQLGKRFNLMAENLQGSLLEIKRKEGFLQGLVDADPDGLRVIDDHYNVLLVNKAYCEQLNLTPAQAVNLSCHQASHDRPTPCAPTMVSCPVKMIGDNGEPIKVLHQHTSANGRKMAVEVYAAPMHIHGDVGATPARPLIIESIRDIGKTLQVSHEQKLSELGRLAAGVAHEIHNPLASVRLALDSTMRFGRQQETTLSPRIEECMALVDNEISRCLEVTERLLKMSMFSGVRDQIVSVNQAIGETLSLLKWEALQDGIEIIEDLDPSQPRVIANESDLRIAVLNLVQNAFHAMPQGGRLTATSRREGQQIKLLIEDTGVGISAEDLPNIFDPFFSRRADNREGTGLGLSITQALMERYHGRIEVFSGPGLGSRFTISFPDPDSSVEEAS